MDQGPVGVLSKSGSAYEHLKRLIVEGQLRPGRRLSPNDLAGEFQISITPVRDALVRLHAEGYVGGEAGRGYFTKPFTVEEQHDLWQILLSTLLTAFEEAGERAAAGLQADVDAYRRERDAAEPAGDLIVRAQEQLMLAVAGRSRSAILPRILRNAVERTQFVRRLDISRPGRREPVASAFDRLVEASVGRQLIEAIAAARAFRADQIAAFPEAVAAANAEIGRNRFP
jgi:DNA-binding GntR family transcriptional regulator